MKQRERVDEHTLVDSVEAVLPSDRQWSLTLSTRIDSALRPALWRIYNDAFVHLAETSLLQQSVNEEDFMRLIDDERTIKVLATDKCGAPIGLALLTNELELVPLLSPAALAKRFPAEYRRNAIYYCIFVFVVPGARPLNLISRLLQAMMDITSARDGIGIFDASAQSRDAGIVTAANRLANRYPDSEFSEIDCQTYYSIKLPHARSCQSDPPADLSPLTPQTHQPVRKRPRWSNGWRVAFSDVS
jgi:hypothetical protein